MKKLTIPKIKDGTVIDHQKVGTVYKAIKILNLEEPMDDNITSTASNVPSSAVPGGKKDILKIENKELSREEVNKIALLSPYATINIIQDYDVKEKYDAELPGNISGIVRCSNPSCISREYEVEDLEIFRREPVEYKFKVIDKEKPILRCYFCDREMEGDKIYDNLIF